MMRPRLPPASWLLLLAAAATQCPDTDETLDLRVVLSDAQGFRRNDVRWSLSAASSMDAYAAGTLVGSGNATLDAGAELALPTLCAEPGNYWLAFQRLPDECVADIELLACATPTKRRCLRSTSGGSGLLGSVSDTTHACFLAC